VLSSSINKGFRGSIGTIITIYLILFSISLFYLNNDKTDYYPNIFYNYLAAQIQSPFLILSINHLVLIGAIILLAFIVSNEEIIDKLNYFPIIIFLVINIIAINKERVSLNLISSIFILYALYKIFNTYRQDNVLSNIYNACFWVSVTLYFNIANIFLLPFIFVALTILRPFNWREYTIALLGFLSPIFIIECISYLFNSNQWYLFESVQELITSFKIPALNIDYLPFLGMCALLFVLSIVRFMVEGFGNTVKKQKSKNCFFWYMLLILPVFFISGTSYEKTMVFYSIPIAFLVGDFFGSIKRIKIANILLIAFILAAGFYMLTKTTLI